MYRVKTIKQFDYSQIYKYEVFQENYIQGSNH